MICSEAAATKIDALSSLRVTHLMTSRALTALCLGPSSPVANSTRGLLGWPLDARKRLADADGRPDPAYERPFASGL
jgi:hypothetical protein